jgi:ribosome-associated heat shock protein Hsp15
MSSNRTEEAFRIDKWLWAARFFKTRALATTAVEGGKVHLNGARTKPAKHLKVGDTLTVHRGEDELTLRVLALSAHRGPAPTAAALYEETPDSQASRAERLARRRLIANSPRPDARPSKKDRRALTRLANRRS